MLHLWSKSLNPIAPQGHGNRKFSGPNRTGETEDRYPYEETWVKTKTENLSRNNCTQNRFVPAILTPSNYHPGFHIRKWKLQHQKSYHHKRIEIQSRFFSRNFPSLAQASWDNEKLFRIAPKIKLWNVISKSPAPIFASREDDPVSPLSQPRAPRMYVNTYVPFSPFPCSFGHSCINHRKLEKTSENKWTSLE